MKIVPLGDRIVVKRLDPEEQTAGGLYLQDNAREKPQQGRVLSVGVGRLLENGSRGPLQVSDGDRVVFDSLAGNEIEVDGDVLLIMNESNILAVV